MGGPQGNPKPYLEGHGDLVSRLLIRKTRVTMRVIGLFTYLLSPPDPPSNPLPSVRVYALKLKRGEKRQFGLPCD